MVSETGSVNLCPERKARELNRAVKVKRSHRAFIFIAFFLIVLCAGCDRYTRYKALTFFFTGVPPLEEEETAGAQIDKGEKQLPAKQKIVSKPIYYSHTPYACSMCDQCHQTSGNFRILGRKRAAAVLRPGIGSPGLLVAPIKELCVMCHKYMSVSTAFTKGLWLHAPAAQGICTICHDPHQSPNRYMLNKKPDKLCTQCHLVGAIMKTRAQKESGGCLRCHNPHLGRTNLLLVKDYKEDKHPVSSLPGNIPERVAAPPESEERSE
jgi:predicted CXXCH cytochrome family protein